jgi:hypothetical protein
VEFLVIIVAAIVGWVFADRFNKANLSNDRLFDQVIESDLFSKSPLAIVGFFGYYMVRSLIGNVGYETTHIPK